MWAVHQPPDIIKNCPVWKSFQPPWSSTWMFAQYLSSKTTRSIGLNPLTICWSKRLVVCCGWATNIRFCSSLTKCWPLILQNKPNAIITRSAKSTEIRQLIEKFPRKSCDPLHSRRKKPSNLRPVSLPWVRLTATLFTWTSPETSSFQFDTICKIINVKVDCRFTKQFLLDGKMVLESVNITIKYQSGDSASSSTGGANNAADDEIVIVADKKIIIKLDFACHWCIWLSVFFLLLDLWGLFALKQKLLTSRTLLWVSDEDKRKKKLHGS